MSTRVDAHNQARQIYYTETGTDWFDAPDSHRSEIGETIGKLVDSGLTAREIAKRAVLVALADADDPTADDEPRTRCSCGSYSC